MLKTIIGALALAATLPAVAAEGGPGLQQESRVVRYDDLNLASPAGLERLDRRIDFAAKSVCGVPSARMSSPGEFAHSRRCMAEAKARAAKQVAALGRQNARGG